MQDSGRAMTRAIIFGGLKMQPRVVSKFANIYSSRGLPTSMVPLNFVSVLARDPTKHFLYKEVRDTMLQEEAVHLHVLSGACHLVTNLFKLHPELKEKVVSQVYDSPCHLNGMGPALRQFYGIPQVITDSLTSTLFPGEPHASRAIAAHAGAGGRPYAPPLGRLA